MGSPSGAFILSRWCEWRLINIGYQRSLYLKFCRTIEIMVALRILVSNKNNTGRPWNWTCSITILNRLLGPLAHKVHNYDLFLSIHSILYYEDFIYTTSLFLLVSRSPCVTPLGAGVMVVRVFTLITSCVNPLYLYPLTKGRAGSFSPQDVGGSLFRRSPPPWRESSYLPLREMPKIGAETA